MSAGSEQKISAPMQAKLDEMAKRLYESDKPEMVMRELTDEWGAPLAALYRVAKRDARFVKRTKGKGTYSLTPAARSAITRSRKKEAAAA